MALSSPPDTPAVGTPSGPPVGPCSLCGAVGPLQFSHIVPAWMHRRVLAGDDGGQHQYAVLSPTKETVVLGNEQLREYLLCRPCEELFGVWERHVSLWAVQDDGSFPILDALDRDPQRVLRPLPGVGQLIDLSFLETSTMARFALSVTWRASASVRYGKVSHLGPYADPIRAFLRDSAAPLPRFVRVCVEAMDRRGRMRTDRSVVGPASENRGGFRAHTFAGSGLRFVSCVGGTRLHALDELCVGTSGRAFLTDGEEQHRTIHGWSATATPKGALAKRSRR